MRYFEFPSADTTIYEGTITSSQNTGLDEILEINKIMNDDGSTVNVSRVLMKFDLSYISRSIVSGLIPHPSGSASKFYLNLYDANSKELTTSDTLYAYPISQSWTNGSGKFSDFPATTEGVSWKYRTGETAADYWVTASDYPLGGGGAWFTGTDGAFSRVASKTFDHETIDLRMDVSNIVNNWIYSSSAYPNEGFIIKRSGSVGNLQTGSSAPPEGNTTWLGNFQFFSRDTHTIYVPKLEVAWDDSSYSTGSLSALSSTNLESVKFYVKNLRPEYKENSKTKIRVVGRERYPTRTYATSSVNLTVKYLPTSSYYSVRDAYSEDVIIPFDNYSKLSCDSTGNYFNFWLKGLQPERYYRLLFRYIANSGSVNEIDERFDDDWIFKVER
jgi:hypothetical protein